MARAADKTARKQPRREAKAKRAAKPSVKPAAKPARKAAAAGEKPPSPLAQHAFKPGQSGNPAGRPRGARNKLGEDFIAALHDDFVVHGVEVIATVREEKPDQYLKVIAAIVPKELNIKSDPFEGISDEQLAAIVAAARDALGVSEDGGGDARPTAH